MKMKILCLNLFLITSACTIGLCDNNNRSDIVQRSEPIIMAFQLKRIDNFLKTPGNNPIELLRRFGRSINFQWNKDSESIFVASVFDKTKSDSGFLKPLKENQLTFRQTREIKAMISKYDSELDEMIRSNNPASQAISIRLVCETHSLRAFLAEIETSKSDLGISTDSSIIKPENKLPPFMEHSKALLGAFHVSGKGCFGQIRIVPDKKVPSEYLKHNITIVKYINDDSLMVFCQIHPITAPNEVMEHLSRFPQTSVMLNLLSLAGLSFEKDILPITAKESILYVNLAPISTTGVPDICFVAAVPDIKKLIDNLEKYKKLCVQTGIFTQAIADKFDIVKLTHFVVPQIEIYAGIVNRFVVIASSQKRLISEMLHITDVASGKKEGNKLPDVYKSYWKIKTKDFNAQLQELLQSPLLSNLRLPPISNLTFLNDLESIVMTSSIKSDYIDFNLDVPMHKE